MEHASGVNGRIRTKCCVVGGGPAGIMLGFLLARRGVPVTILEKHKDFFRDFRGDTVHPSTLEVMRELGILEGFLKVPHQKLTSVGGKFGSFSFQGADLRKLPTHCKFIALMPQWDLLEFLSTQGRKYPQFDLRMECEAVELRRDKDRVVGVLARTPEGTIEIEAGLVIGCDGRRSTTRKAAGFQVIETGVPIDVLWFRISRKSNDPEQLLGNVNYGKALILIDRSDYFQAGLIIPKGSFEYIQQRGLDPFKADLQRIAPFLGDRVNELEDWDQIKLLTVQINRLKRWHRPGLLCIGDAAHAMSPAGGVGINLAIQDAVATANILADALRHDCVSESLLARVQRRREFPARIIQTVQALAHRGLARVFQNPGEVKAPWPFKLVVQVPGFQHALGRFVGMGPRPEHVQHHDEPRPHGRRSLQTAIALSAALATVVIGVQMLQKDAAEVA